MSKSEEYLSAEKSLKIGKLNLPTITFITLLLSTISFLLLDVAHIYGDYVFLIQVLSCLISSFLGLITLIFLIVKGKKFGNHPDKTSYILAFFIAAIAFVSPLIFLFLYLNKMVSLVR